MRKLSCLLITLFCLISLFLILGNNLIAEEKSTGHKIILISKRYWDGISGGANEVDTVIPLFSLKPGPV